MKRYAVMHGDDILRLFSTLREAKGLAHSLTVGSPRRYDQFGNEMRRSASEMPMKDVWVKDREMGTAVNPGRRNAGGTSMARAARGVTLRNMASVTIKRLPGGAVAVTGRKLNGARRKR
jgi:hypothetical protein